VRVAQTFEDEDGTDAASRTLGLVSPAADEFRLLGVDADALAAFAGAGRGRELPLDAEEPAADVWRHDIEASAFPTPIWPWLLLLAIALVPLDVGVRRVALSRTDFARARDWIGRRVGLVRAEPEAVPGLAELRAARERSARRADRAPASVTAPAAEVGTTARAADAAAVSPERSPTPSPVPAETPRPAPAAAPSVEPAPGATPEPAVPGETLAERLARRRRGG
jgi:hypothetical protein